MSYKPERKASLETALMAISSWILASKVVRKWISIVQAIQSVLFCFGRLSNQPIAPILSPAYYEFRICVCGSCRHSKLIKRFTSLLCVGPDSLLLYLKKKSPPLFHRCSLVPPHPAASLPMCVLACVCLCMYTHVKVVLRNSHCIAHYSKT